MREGEERWKVGGKEGGKEGEKEGRREKGRRGGGMDEVTDQRVVTAARPFPLHEHARHIQRLRIRKS